MKRLVGISILGVSVLLATAGCSGGSKKEKSTAPEPAGNPQPRKNPANPPPAEDARPAPREDMAVKGILGTIDEEAVGRAFRRKGYQIEQCILNNARPMTYITGKMKFKFTIALDGTIKLEVMENNVGHHKVEACLIQVARSLSFGKPKGGKVIIRYPLDIPNRGTPHVAWSKARVKKAMKSRLSAIRACRKAGKPRRFTVNFYVLPGGRVVSAGVHTKGQIPSGFAGCVLVALQQATFPDTLGKVAKVSYPIR